jgi:hypothetical protein
MAPLDRSTHKSAAGVNAKLADALLHQSGALSALTALQEADDAAALAGDCPWQFAVEVQAMLIGGTSVNLLRWLVRAGLAEHRQEISQPADTARKFLSFANLSFPERTCLVLTDPGLAWARLKRVEAHTANGSPPAATQRHGRVKAAARPCWDAQRRELCFAGHLVKAYRVPAENQERVLAAFQEAGWPACLDDPLPAKPEQNASRRLHETIQKLNRTMHSKLLRFRGDGTGTRVCWESHAAKVGK